MSDTNHGLGFYIVYGPDDSYSLYNAMTDKDILFAVEREELESFLAMNCPTHPFLYYTEVTDPSFTIDTNVWAGLDYAPDSLLDSMSGETWDSSIDFSILTDTLKELNSDYAYLNPNLVTSQRKDIKHPSQLSFSFMDNLKVKPSSNEEVTGDDIPFLPDDE